MTISEYPFRVSAPGPISAPETDPSPYPDRVGPYRILGRLGSGGMGEVFRAVDQRLERQVALKRVRARAASHQARQRFRREARLAARLHHPSIVAIHDLIPAANDDPEGADWIVLELLDGQPLRDHLEAGRPDSMRLLELALDIASALAAAHREGIVHRDLKSSNIFVTRDGRAKVLDFGLAKQVLHRDPNAATVTLDGHVVGTPHAMSPEQVLGRPIDPRSDLFSFGSLLYEMISGLPPFLAENPIESSSRVCTHRPDSLDTLMQGLLSGISELVDSLLEKEPAHRPRSAADVHHSLQTLLDSARRQPPTEPLRLRDAEKPTAAGVPGVPRPTRGSTASPFGEQRQITIAACELMLPETSAGPFDSHASLVALESLETTAREVIEGYGGRIANFLGRRIVAYFGYPKAREDDARRTVMAVLELASRVRSSAAAESPLRLRAGIHTGRAVVMRSRAGTLQVAPGRTLDLCDRLMRRAEPGAVVTSGVTRRLLEKDFEVDETNEDPGTEERRSSGAYRIIAARERSSEIFEVKADSTPLVQREQELDLLVDRWQQAAAGRGQIVTIRGEAGIGKSRLVRELYRALHHEPLQAPRWLLAQGVSYASHTPFQPILDLLESILDIRRGELGAEAIQRLEQRLDGAGFDPRTSTPLLATLFGVDLSATHPLPDWSPGRLRQATLETLVRLLTLDAEARPTLILFEDLHWMDPSTLEVLDLLVEAIDACPILLLVTSREPTPGSWSGGGRTTGLDLDRLAGAGPRALIEHVTEGRALPEAVIDRILQKTDGIPLFVEELTRNLLQSDRLVLEGDHYRLEGAVDELMIPATLRDSLTARLDRLGEAKLTAQLAAVIGREFSIELLRAISPSEPGTLDRDLAELVRARLVHRKGFSARKRYFFEHALIQDAAYASLLFKDRQQIHSRLARAMESSGDIARHRPELLAHHFSAAGEKAEALDCWERAGLEALIRSAHHESTHHFEKGLEVLGDLEDSAERDGRELALLSSYGAALSAVSGYGADKVETTFDRVGWLCRKQGDTPLEILWRTWPFFQVRGDRETAFRHLANFDLDHETEIHRFVGHTAHGMAKLFDGNFPETRAHLAEATALFPRVRDQLAARQMLDAGAYSLLYDAWCSCLIGRPAEAREKLDRALLEAEAMADPHIRAAALCFAIAVTYELRDEAAVRDYSERCLALCSEQGFPHWIGASKLSLGWARRHQDPDGALISMRDGLQEYLRTGARFPRAYWITYLLDALLDLDRSAEGLEVAATALDWSRTYLDSFYEGEHLRLEAELLHRTGVRGEAIDSRLERAAEIALAQGSDLLLLRVAVVRARLAGCDGQSEHSEELERILSRFPESDRSPELEKARALRGSKADSLVLGT